MSLMYNKKNIGPNTFPFGTPVVDNFLNARTETRADSGISLSVDSEETDFVEKFYVRHFIEGFTEVQKKYLYLVLSVDRIRQLMYSTNERCITRNTLSEAMLIRV